MNRLQLRNNWSGPVALALLLLVLAVLSGCVSLSVEESPEDTPEEIPPVVTAPVIPETPDVPVMPEPEEDVPPSADADADVDSDVDSDAPARSPEPAGPAPRPEQIPALMRYIREFTEASGPDPLQRPPGYPPEAAALLERYLRGFNRHGTELSLVPAYEKRGAAHYGRMDIVVAPLTPFREEVAPVLVRGGTVYSGVSALDAELASLHLFPRDDLDRAVARVLTETDYVVRRRGIPARVGALDFLTVEEREWVDAVLWSLGRWSGTGQRWWFHVPPPVVEERLRERISAPAISVEIDDERKMSSR